MKRWLLALSLALCSIALLPSVADAKRLGGGGSTGMQRSLPARSTPDALPAKPAPNNAAAAPAPTAPAAAAAAAPKRSWMGPIAGLAAGLGLAALASHFGFGDELANVMMIALLAMVVVFVVRLLMRRFGSNGAAPAGMRLAGAGAPVPAENGAWRTAQPVAAAAMAPSAGAPSQVPAGFDAAGFERIAKMIFIRMQAANDSADLNDLRAFTTPELFASVRLDLQERGNAPQQTDVVQIDAEVLDVAQEAERQVVSVRFHGLVRELRDSGATPFDEVWHLVRPVDGSREWAIAGIQQMAVA
jgi:predicted lipid-binding transport protein (Tim44 family)